MRPHTNRHHTDRLLDLVEQGVISADHVVVMCMKWMSDDDVGEMLDANELSPRFDDDEEENHEL